MTLGEQISLITTAETLLLRQKVLRPLQRIEDCCSPQDDDPLTFHLGLFCGGQLAAVATFQHQPHPDLPAGFPFRLRWMAADDKFRRRGFGGRLLRHGIEILRQKRCDLLWFNARLKSFEFYQSLGFHFHSELFDMPGIGPHKVMYKHLIPR